MVSLARDLDGPQNALRLRGLEGWCRYERVHKNGNGIRIRHPRSAMPDAENAWPDEPSDGWDGWLARFTQYVDGSAERVRRTTELNRSLTKRVADGSLPPVVVESRLAAFVGQNAEAHANEMTRLAMHFLSSLVEVNAGYVREVVESMTPDGPTTDTCEAPMFDPADDVDWYDRLDQYAAAQRSLLDGLIRSATASAVVPERPRNASQDRSSPAVRRMADVFLDLITRLDEINTGYAHRYLEDVLALPGPSERSEAQATAVAALGDTATVRFAVSNNTESTAIVRCVVTDLRRDDGVGPAFVPAATITPNRFSLRSGGEETVTLSIALEAPAFVQGPVYSGGIHIMGVGDTVVDIPLRVRASEPTAPAVVAAGPS
jgi:hypothetical protein